MNKEFKNHYLKKAIPGWEKIDKNDLANMVIESEGTPEYDSYLAALICKYMYKIYSLVPRFGNYINEEEMTDLVVDGILRALKYRSWLRPETPVYGDKDGPDKTINRCIKSTCQVFKRLNFGAKKNTADNRRIKYFTVSLDQSTEDYGDYYYNLVDENFGDGNLSLTDSLIKSYISKDKLLSAIILDIICYQDSFKEYEKTVNVEYEIKKGEEIELKEDKVKITNIEFDRKKLIKNLSNMNDNYKTYFTNKYTVTFDEVNSVENMLKKNGKINRKYLYRYIDKMFEELKTNKEFLEGITC